MVARPRPSAAPRERPATPERAAGALVRWRAWRLLRALPPQQRRAVRLLPALFQADFAGGELASGAPGVDGVAAGAHWARWARVLGLPGTHTARAGRALVYSLFVLPAPDGALDVRLVLLPGLTRAEQARVAARAGAVERTLAKVGVTVRVSSQPARPEPRDAPRVLALAAFGALVAGRVPPSLFQVEPGRALDAALVGHLVEAAPTPLCALALGLLARGTALQPGEVWLHGRWRGLTLRALADPERLCLLWAALDSGDEPLCEVLRELTRPTAAARPAADVLALGAALTRALLLAARGVPRGVRAPLEARLRREVLAHGVPSPLLPALGRALRLGRADAAQVVLAARPVRGGWEVRDRSGAVLGRGRGEAQARVRALALARAALGEVPRAALPDATWQRAAEALGPGPARRVVLVEAPPGTDAVPDAARALRFTSAVVLCVRDGARPSARRLSAEATLRRLLAPDARGLPREVLAVHADAQPAAARLRQLDALAPAAREAGLELAVSGGERVWALSRGRVRHHPLERFLRRPRRLACDADSHALAGAEAHGLDAPRSPGLLTCAATPLAGGREAALLYATHDGLRLRERVPLPLAEQHLADAQRLLRALPGAPRLAVVAPRALELAGRALHAAAPAPVLLELEAELARGHLTLVLDGERYGHGGRLGLGAAAQVVLSRWPQGTRGALSFTRVAATLHGRPAGALGVLYARSLALRRMWAQLAVYERA